MEQYIKNNLSDITYVSELILDILDVKDVIRTITYSHCRVPACRQAGVSYVLIKGYAAIRNAQDPEGNS